MNKRGQFYLLAAIIIIAIIIGFAAVVNYSKRSDIVRLYDLGDELGIEGGYIIDFGTFQGESLNPDDDLIKHFTTIYDEFAGKDKEIYYVIGNKDGISAYRYLKDDGGKVSYNFEGTPTGTPILSKFREDIKTEDIKISSDKIVVRLEMVEYEFELKEGENFYFVIMQELGDEKHVVTT